MFINPTLEKLRAMRLKGLAEALVRQMEDPSMAQLSFEERVSLLVDHLWTWRENRALGRRLQQARFKMQAAVEDINYQHPRGLDRGLVRSLSTSHWVRSHHNLIVVGSCGVGKTFLACALAQRAVRDGFSALYTRAPRLFRELTIARADGSLDKLFARWARVDVLVVDDWLMTPLTLSESRDFREICEDRFESRSTLLTSQVPVLHWHEQIGDPTLADGILDRLINNAYRLELQGESLRKTKGPQPPDGEDQP